MAQVENRAFGERGASARIHTRPTHGQARQIAKVYAQSMGSDDPLAIEPRVILLLVTEWSGVRDPDTGEELPLSTEGLERADAEDVNALFAIVEPIAGASIPKLA